MCIRVETTVTLNESIRQILAYDHFATSQQTGELMKNRLSEKASPGQELIEFKGIEIRRNKK